jgi:hypothetical protein
MLAAPRLADGRTTHRGAGRVGERLESMSLTSRWRRQEGRAFASPPATRPAGTRRSLTRAADAARVVLFCSGAAWLFAGDGAAALRALLVLPPALLGRFGRVHPAFDLLFTSALAIEATATGLGAYDSIAWGDTLSHFVLPLLSVPVVYGGLVRLSAAAAPSAAHPARACVGAAVVTGASVLALGALWELVEWAADGAFGTNYSEGHRDTLVDLLADALAAITGGGLLGVWLWGNSRALRSMDKTHDLNTKDGVHRGWHDDDA